MDYIKLISLIKNEYKSYFERINDFLRNDDILKITKEYEDFKIKKPFNIILAASEKFFYENLHSDILAFILSPENSPGSFPTYLNLFINYLNTISAIKIDYNNYRSAEILREEGKVEEGRIEILIRDRETKHCIIIENKINNAKDMNRQLPRYINAQKNVYKIDGIVYYSLLGDKKPEKYKWSSVDEIMINENTIIYMAAYNKTDKGIIKGFLNKCMELNNSISELSFLNQYCELLEFIGGKGMNTEIMKIFYEHMLVEEKYCTANNIRNMLNDLRTYRRNELHNIFLYQHEPFKNINIYSDNVTYFANLQNYDDELIKIDLRCEDDVTKMDFWIQSPEIKKDLINEILKNINELNNFVKLKDNYYQKVFIFPTEEKQLIDYINIFLNKLKIFINEPINK